MSMYCSVQTQFKSAEALIAALMESGQWQASQIEVHEVPQNLYGYKGDMREQTAHIIIRRQNVGGSSNDLGFLKKEDGTYEAIVSQFDKRKYNDSWMAGLKGNYAFHVIRQQQERRGRSVRRERLPNGRQRVLVGGYR